MAAAAQRSESYKAQREVEDLHLVLRARTGNRASEAEIIRRYAGFVRLHSSSYFIAGGDPDDLLAGGPVGLYKAIRDYRVDKDTSFRSFAELCITRQIITAIKGATRHKHGPLNGYISFCHTPAGQDAGSATSRSATRWPDRPFTTPRAASSRPRGSRRSSAASARASRSSRARVLTLFWRASRTR